MKILDKNYMLTNIARNKLSVVIIISLATLGLYIIMPLSKPLPINLFIPTNIEQDALKFLPKEFNPNTPLLSTSKQTAKTKDFLKRYFSPWSSAKDLKKTSIGRLTPFE